MCKEEYEVGHLADTIFLLQIIIDNATLNIRMAEARTEQTQGVWGKVTERLDRTLHDIGITGLDKEPTAVKSAALTSTLAAKAFLPAFLSNRLNFPNRSPGASLQQFGFHGEVLSFLVTGILAGRGEDPRVLLLGGGLTYLLSRFASLKGEQRAIRSGSLPK